MSITTNIVRQVSAIARSGAGRKLPADLARQVPAKMREQVFHVSEFTMRDGAKQQVKFRARVVQETLYRGKPLVTSSSFIQGIYDKLTNTVIEFRRVMGR